MCLCASSGASMTRCPRALSIPQSAVARHDRGELRHIHVQTHGQIADIVAGINASEELCEQTAHGTRAQHVLVKMKRPIGPIARQPWPYTECESVSLIRTPRVSGRVDKTSIFALHFNGTEADLINWSKSYRVNMHAHRTWGSRRHHHVTLGLARPRRPSPDPRPWHDLAAARQDG
jgi:hypothetical protein